MGFQKDTYETQKSYRDDIITEPSLEDNSREIARKNSVGERINVILESICLFFSTVAIKPRSSSTNTMSYTTQHSSDSSSGCFSLDNSVELEESYIKVAKFTENEAENNDGQYGTYKEYKEMAQQQSLAAQIKEIVETNTAVTYMQISDYLTLRTAGDVMNLSKYEPYGLKGCKLIIVIEENGVASNLGSIFPEKGIVCTFEITLVLHVKKSPCRRLPFLNCQKNILQVLEQYELRKEKMYKRKSSPIL